MRRQIRWLLLGLLSSALISVAALRSRPGRPSIYGIYPQMSRHEIPQSLGCGKPTFKGKGRLMRVDEYWTVYEVGDVEVLVAFDGNKVGAVLGSRVDISGRTFLSGISLRELERYLGPHDYASKWGYHYPKSELIVCCNGLGDHVTDFIIGELPRPNKARLLDDNSDASSSGCAPDHPARQSENTGR